MVMPGHLSVREEIVKTVHDHYHHHYVGKRAEERSLSSLSIHTSNLKPDTPVATLPGVWLSRVSARTGWPGVSEL